MKLLRRCFAPETLVSPLRRLLAGIAPVSLLGLSLARRLLVAPPDAGFVAWAVVVCWGCPDLAMKDSSSGRSAHVPRGMENQSPS
ncbi:hypothetical protein CRG98_033160 [Punica granatum]|uniref:Uncharacterized protein n=1 Tax=Punica granatum TaxID=22663 RepID=A0A2I0IR42_PUNGR|nr:hypothetical protein CRG98_033160 [Punica granatum]